MKPDKPSSSASRPAAIVTLLGLGLALQVHAAQTTTERPALLMPAASAGALPAPKRSAVAAPTAKSGSSAPAQPRRSARTRALGGDDDLKDLEVERARGKAR